MESNPLDLSVIITMVGGAPFLRRCLEALLPQTRGRRVEVIVPFDSTTEGITPLQAEFPHVCFADMGVVRTMACAGTQSALHEIYDRRTSKGLSQARGAILALIQDYEIPAPDYVEQVLCAHKLPYGVMGGAVEHAGRGALNWAVYFMDFGRYQLPLPEGPAAYVTDVNNSYKRAALESVRELWADRYNEVKVNWALARRGETLWMRPQIVVRQDRGALAFRREAVERFAWGQLFGAVRVHELSAFRRVVFLLISPVMPLVLVSRIAFRIARTRRNVNAFLRSLPLLFAMTGCWCLGEWAGYLTARESAL